MKEKNKLYYIYGISTIFVLIVAYCIAKNIPFVPLAIPLIIIGFALYFFAYDKVLLLIALLTPISIELGSKEFGFTISFPSEVLLILMVIMVFLKFLSDRKIDKQFLKHPITILIILNLIWMFITTLTSEMFLVSFKYFLARLWFVIPCYFVGVEIFKAQKNIEKYNWAYIFSLCIVIVYTLIRHSARGFSQSSSVLIMRPLFPEHTSYGAMLVFVVPFLVFSLFRTGKKPIYKIITACVLVLVLAGLIFSFTRAAWLGGIIALIIIILYLFKVKLRYILSVGILFFVLFFAFQEQIIVALKKNSQDSSQNFIEHVQSMSNISTDASNLERINRWQSAIRMFKERPLVGWGPGTYQFVYSPFQRSQEKTIISTNAGDGGNAHSEYLGTLSEQGIIGLIIIVILYITMIYTANKVFWKSKNKFDRYMSLTCMLALVTYFVHGFLNNFLDIDKAAVLFWLYVAIIVSLDLKYRNEHKKLSENSKSDSE